MTVPEKPPIRKEDLFRVKILAVHPAGGVQIEATTYCGRRVLGWIGVGDQITFSHDTHWTFGDESAVAGVAAAAIERAKR